MPKWTAEQIMTRCLSRITKINELKGSKNSNDKRKESKNIIDTREGSIIWDALMPAALELETLYCELDELYKNAFADTANWDYLVRIGAERGISPYEASYAMIKGEFSEEVKKGTLFTIGKLGYVVSSDCVKNGSLYEAYLLAEKPGTQYNISSGKLNSDYYNLEIARIKELARPAREKETLEEFRTRYFKEIRKKNFGGNIEDYERWTLGLDGVGAVKVFPIWQGGGTVKVVITGSDGLSPSSKLIDDVQTALDPVTNRGKGIGIAPIGHTVTVAGAAEHNINVKIKLVFQTGYNKENTAEIVNNVIKKYLADQRSLWGKKEIVLRSANLIARFIDQDKYFLDCEYISLNDEKTRLVLDEEALPVLGRVEFLDKAPEGMCEAK